MSNLKVEYKQTPHEKVLCVVLLTKFANKMAECDNKFERSMWHLELLKEINHLV